MGFMDIKPEKGIEFIDRPLKEGEESNYRCGDCKAYLHPDLVQEHRCNPLTKGVSNFKFNKFSKKLLEKRV
jgi:hypothetical protein